MVRPRSPLQVARRCAALDGLGRRECGKFPSSTAGRCGRTTSNLRSRCRRRNLVLCGAGLASRLGGKRWSRSGETAAFVELAIVDTKRTSAHGHDAPEPAGPGGARRIGPSWVPSRSRRAQISVSGRRSRAASDGSRYRRPGEVGRAVPMARGFVDLQDRVYLSVYTHTPRGGWLGRPPVIPRPGSGARVSGVRRADLGGDFGSVAGVLPRAATCLAVGRLCLAPHLPDGQPDGSSARSMTDDRTLPRRIRAGPPSVLDSRALGWRLRL